MSAAGDDNENDQDKALAPSVKYLLGGAGLLQALLTTVGITGGGISALVINDRWLVISGFLAVLLAIFTAALVIAVNPSKGRRTIITAGTVMLFIGLAITGVVALVGPAVAKAPSINVALSQSSGKLILTAHVKASGIPDSSQYWFEIDAREYKQAGGKYDLLGTPLYQNQLGADSQGNVDTIVTIPLPPGNYPAVSIEAWNGPHSGPCGSLEVPGGATLAHSANSNSALEENARVGCVILRLPASSPSSR
jgi:hypothetical protein